MMERNIGQRVPTEVTQGSKRLRCVNGTERDSSQSIPCCYLVRGACEQEWYIWNVNALALTFSKGDMLRCISVTTDLECASCIWLDILQGFTVCGMASVKCVLEHEIHSCDPIAGLETMLTQSTLNTVCMGKGVKCGVLLQELCSSILPSRGRFMWALRFGEYNEKGIRITGFSIS